MSFSPDILKTFAVAAALALPLALGACSGEPRVRLCGESAPGKLSVGEVFNGASGRHNLVCRVEGQDLAAGTRYSFEDGLVVVDGDFPAGARLGVDDGKVVVTGDVGAGAVIGASVPEETGMFTTFIPIYNGQTTILIPQTHYYFDSYTYAGDSDPAVIVLGSVGERARLTSNHGAYVGGAMAEDADVRITQDDFRPFLTREQRAPFFVQPHL